MWLVQNGPDAPSALWLAEFRRIVQAHFAYLASTLAGDSFLWAAFLVVLAWVRHLHHRLGQWQRGCLPSVPLVCGAGVICMWRLTSEAPEARLGKVPEKDRWTYAVQPDGLRLVRVRCLREASPLARPVLLSQPCARCGRLVLLDALLDLPPAGAPAWTPFCAPGC